MNIIKDIFWTFVSVAVGLYFFYNIQTKRTEQQVEQTRQAAVVSTSGLVDAETDLGAAKEPIDDEKRVLALRQVAHDSMCHVFTAQLPTKMQAFLDMDYYLTIGQQRGAELGSKSGLVATRAVLESLAVDWPEGGQPATFEETAKQIQTYTVVYTIYWQTADGTAAGFYQFEHRFNLQTGETLSVRLLRTGDI